MINIAIFRFHLKVFLYSNLQSLNDLTFTSCRRFDVWWQNCQWIHVPDSDIIKKVLHAWIATSPCNIQPLVELKWMILVFKRVETLLNKISMFKGTHILGLNATDIFFGVYDTLQDVITSIWWKSFIWWNICKRWFSYFMTHVKL